MTEAEADHLLVLMMDGAEEGFKQVVAQLTKNRIDRTMTEQQFVGALANAFTLFRSVSAEIGRVV